LALSACSSSSKPASGPTTTTKPITTADFCAQVKSEIDAFDITGITKKSAGDLKRIYDDGADKLDALATDAPPEIHTDMQTFVTLAKQLRAELADVDYDASQLSLSAIPALTSPATITSVTNIGHYLRDQCHLVSAQSDG
jgi:hypothetical protein